MIPRPDFGGPAATREPNTRSEWRTVFSDDEFPFRIGDAVGCLSSEADGFCALGTVRAIRPNPDGQTELDEFLVELSPTIMGVYHADQLVLRAPSVGRAA
jgi:hypothetical protein